jgi:phospholipid/cholesterol/gamma-HCH transport system permease protein
VFGDRTITALGARAVAIARDVGGIAILTGQVLRAMLPPRLDGRELIRNLHKMGNRSLPIVALTAFFAGGLMVVQSAPFVHRLGATSLAGWAAGYAVLREIGPILIGLMFSGRVGANNTAELGTMTVTEQLDGLRALAIDPIRYLIVPRVLAMLVMLTALTIIGDLVALVGAAVVARLVLDIDWRTMYVSFADNLTPHDFFHGVEKSVAFGAVGRAVNAAVVAAAVSIMLLDFFITYGTA